MRKFCKTYLVGLTALALTLCISFSAQAKLIVDTGQPPTPPNPAGISLFAGQGFAGQFTISEEYVATSVKGWIGGNAGSLAIAILTDNNGTPGDPKFSQNFNTSTADAAWQGPTGLNWVLPAGTYWAAFLPISIDAYMPTPAPSPLVWYAWSQGENWGVVNADYDWVGIRVEGVAVQRSYISGILELLLLN
jgi:hypothetical protein